jgi:hypothetical protein
MARSGRPIRSQPRPKSGARKGRRTDPPLAEANDWYETSERILDRWQSLRNQGKRTPYDERNSYLKREVYRFVCGYLDAGTEHALRHVLEGEREDFPTSTTFRENPFHWAFFALRDPSAPDAIEKFEVSRFGRQLLYARRHRIPPELLVGFIHQSGGPDAVYRKVGAGVLEEWASDYFQWLDAQRAQGT